jgi:hypothetical protein
MASLKDLQRERQILMKDKPCLSLTGLDCLMGNLRKYGNQEITMEEEDEFEPNTCGIDTQTCDSPSKSQLS